MNCSFTSYIFWFNFFKAVYSNRWYYRERFVRSRQSVLVCNLRALFLPHLLWTVTAAAIAHPIRLSCPILYKTEQGDNGGRSTRKRGRRGKPRKNTSIDDVTCEDIFSLHLPEHGNIKSTSNNSNNNGGASASNGGAAAASGDGCYVSALIHNRRYYGVLFDQEALKAASS